MCGAVVSTTADPNNREGWFVSLEVAEKLETDVAGCRSDDFYYRGWLSDHAVPLVMCEHCQERWRE
jgi:hypothetical protein